MSVRQIFAEFRFIFVKRSCSRPRRQKAQPVCFPYFKKSTLCTILESITYERGSHTFGEYHICKQRMQRMYADTLFAFRSKRKQTKQRIRIRCGWHRTAYIVYVCDILQNGTIGWRRGDELLNKVIIFVLFAHKKYSRCFVKLWLNHWCDMNYFNKLLGMFLSLDHVRILAVYGGSQSSRNASKIS